MNRVLDRIPQEDPRNAEYPIRPLLATAAPLRERKWRLHLRQDQGQEGACVEFGWCHELSARPHVVPAKECRRITREHLIYFPAQEKHDHLAGGAYPGATPFYEGTSVLAGAKATAELGHLREYRWASSAAEVAQNISQRGGVVLGLDWYEGMSRPKSDGVIEPTGTILGGHCVAALATRKRGGQWFVGGPNSWDDAWGDRGWWWMKLDHLGQLLDAGGDACIPVR